MKLHTFTLAFALALVITGLCASSMVWAGASASADRTLQLHMQGDAAERIRATLQVIKNLCATGAITWTQRGSAQTHITCPLAQPAQDARLRRFTHLDFRFDAPAARLAMQAAACDSPGTWVSVAGKAVLLATDCTRSAEPPPSTALSTVNPGPVAREWKAVFQTHPMQESVSR